MKKLITLFSITAALGMLATVAGAAPDGYESFNLKLTLNYQLNPSGDDWKVGRISFSNKDLLGLVGNEFDMTFPSGSYLAMYGLGTSPSNQFLVFSKGGDVLLPNASRNESVTDSYRFSFLPDMHSYNETHSSDSDKWNFVSDCGEFRYRGALDGFYVDAKGPVTFSDSYKGGYIESYKEPASSGQFYLNSGGTLGNIFGLSSGNFSGSGRDISFPWIGFAPSPAPPSTP